MRVVIAGGAGYCGRLLRQYWEGPGHQVTLLSRTPGPGCLVWDGRTLGTWADAIDGCDALVNLAGRSVNCRYNAQHCMEIYASRLDSTKVLADAVASCANPPPVWLNASSATIYKSAYDRPMDEASGEIGTGFSVDVCRRWEAELARAATPKTRKVALRSSIVFAPTRGFDSPYDAFAGLARWGLLGSMAGGRQWVSWIHEQDFCRAVSWLIERTDLEGAVNVAGPAPLQNNEFCRILRRDLGALFGLPSAYWMLALGAWARGTETELIVKSRRVVPTRLLESGFRFNFPTWREASRDLAKRYKVGVRLT